jgi:hypothetical protein
MELGKDVSAETDTRLVAGSYYRGNESIIAFQGLTMCDIFAVHTNTLKEFKRR